MVETNTQRILKAKRLIHEAESLLRKVEDPDSVLIESRDYLCSAEHSLGEIINTSPEVLALFAVCEEMGMVPANG